MRKLKERKAIRDKQRASKMSSNIVQAFGSAYNAKQSIDATRYSSKNIRSQRATGKIPKQGKVYPGADDRRKIKSHLKIEESDEELDPEEIVRRAEEDLKRIDNIYRNNDNEGKEENVYTRNGIKDSDGKQPWQGGGKLFSPFIARNADSTDQGSRSQSLQQSNSNTSELDKTAQSRSNESEDSEQLSGDDQNN